MQRLTLGQDRPGGLRLLAIGAHADDIEIGAGGTILRLVAEGRLASVRWIVFSGEGVRRDEATKAADAFLSDVPNREVVVESFRDGYFPSTMAQIKDVFERMKGDFVPDLILTHRKEDAHQDHRVIAELTWNTYRDHVILEYEVAKYDADLGSPNLYVELDAGTCARKLEIIQTIFESQANRTWFSEDAFRGLMRIRGTESNSRTSLAEGFTARKLVY